MQEQKTENSIKKTLKITLDWNIKEDREIIEFIENTKKKQTEMRIGKPLDDNFLARLLLSSPNKTIQKNADKAFHETLNEEDKIKAIYEAYKLEADTPDMSKTEFIIGPYRSLNDRKIQNLINSYIQ